MKVKIVRDGKDFAIVEDGVKGKLRFYTKFAAKKFLKMYIRKFGKDGEK